jgi:hypothetical protein
MSLTRPGSSQWLRGAIAAVILVCATTASAAALDVRVKDVRVAAVDGGQKPSGTVLCTIELRDVLPEKFIRLIDGGGALHLRMQAELWESRPVFDRLVFPAIVQILRFARVRPGRDISIATSTGTITNYLEVPSPLPVDVQLGRSDRVTRDARYYVHVIATLGTLPEREIDDVGDAVFGRPSEANGLGSFGRMLFRGMIEISDYLQSQTVEVKSKPTKLNW